MRILDNFMRLHFFCLNCSFWIRTLTVLPLKWEQNFKTFYLYIFIQKKSRWFYLKACRTCFYICMLVYVCVCLYTRKITYQVKMNNWITWKIICGQDNVGHVYANKWFSAIGGVSRSKQLLLQLLHLNGISVRVFVLSSVWSSALSILTT